ncbi:hypothetical protein SK128_020196 [Halocaridina rubra]|uniref:Uncharacterized protein n=1 Tax=Halocaridina rubra TaxID=373956 RepID=A0AAN8X5D4_HALRR
MKYNEYRELLERRGTQSSQSGKMASTDSAVAFTEEQLQELCETFTSSIYPYSLHIRK